MNSSKITYGLTVAAVGVAVVVRWLLIPFLGDEAPFSSFIIAVIFVARYQRFRQSLLATILGFVAAVVWFMPSAFASFDLSVTSLTRFGIYFVICGAIATFGEAARRGQDLALRAKNSADQQAESLRITLASIGDAIITTDHQGRVTYLNPIAENLTGFSAVDAIGLPLEDVFRIVNETSRRPVDNPVSIALKTGTIVGLANHTILIAKDGAEHFIDDSASPIRNKSDEVVGCVLIFRDIGDQRKLQKQASMLASIVLSSDDAIIGKSLDGVILSWNAAAERLFGHTAEQAVGRPMSIVIPADRGFEEEHILSELRAGRRIENFDTVRVRRDGTPIHVSLTISPIRDESGKVTGASKIVRDISERKLAEERLRDSEARKSAVLLSALDCIISVDQQGKILEFNPAAERAFGYRREDVLGRDMVELIVPSGLRETCRSGMAEYVLNGASKILNERVELIALRSNGSEFPIELSVTRISLNGPSIFTAYLRDITERKQAELKLTESRSRLESTLVAGEIGTWEFDIVKNSVRADQNLARMFGVTPEEAAGGPLEVFTRAIHPDDIEQVERAIGRALESGSSFESEYRVIGTGGALRWVVARGRVHRDAEGRPLRLPGVVMDITRQKLIEAELRSSEDRRKLALEAAELGAWNVDPETMSLTTDARFREIFGVHGGSLDYPHAVSLIHADDRNGVELAVAAATRPVDPAPYAVEYRVLRADGSFRWVFAKGRANFAGERLISFDGTLADITDRKRSEELLRDSENRLRYILDSMPQKVFTATADGKVDYVNPLWMEFSGMPFEEIRDWGWAALFHPDVVTENLREWNQAVDSGEPFQFEHRFRRADGIYRWHVSRATPLRDASGKLQMWVGANTDIHEQRQTADELREVAARLSEADHRKNEFLATLAHELRNPLAPLRNGLQVMKLAKDDAEAVSQSRTMMERQLDQMVRLVDDLMDVSRISRGKLDLKMQRVDLSTVVSSAIETSRPLIDQMRHRLTVTLPEEPIFISADLTRLAQVFLNLLNNAAKYSEPNGHIQLAVKRLGAEALVSVQDTGIGIDSDNLPKIFDMFSQVDRSLEKSQGGLGIGLTLVRRIIELHSGSVVARSEGAGRGSEFLVRLPIETAVFELPVSLENDQQALPKSALRILVVDDNRDSAYSLSLMLKIIGNDTHMAFDGEEALEAAGSFRPDVILLDIGLPKLNGFEVCRRIRQQPWGKNIVIIAQTGWGQDEDRQRTLDAGFNHHKVKPIDPTELMVILAESSFKPRQRRPGDRSESEP